MGEKDTNNNPILDLRTRSKNCDARVGVDLRDDSRESKAIKMKMHEAHAELIFRKYLAEPSRLKKINMLIETIRKQEKQRVTHIQSPEYFKAIQELELLGGTVEKEETDSDCGLTEFLLTDSSEKELEKDYIPRSVGDGRFYREQNQRNPEKQKRGLENDDSEQSRDRQENSMERI